MRHDQPQKLLPPQSPDQRARQLRSPKLPTVLHPHRRRIDLHPARRRVVKQRRRPHLAAVTLRRLLHAQPALFVQNSQLHDHALPRPTLGAIRLDQRPIHPLLPTRRPKALPNKHAEMLRRPTPPPRSSVVTTQRSQPHPARLLPSTNNLRSQLTSRYFRNRNLLIELGKLG